MKKYITLFSLIPLFFIGMQQTQAQELERRSLDESQGKDKQVQMKELASKDINSPEYKASEQLKQLKYGTELTPEQEKSAGLVFSDYQLKMIELGEDDNSEEFQNQKALLDDKVTTKLIELLSEEQYGNYLGYLEKLKKQ